MRKQRQSANTRARTHARPARSIAPVAALPTSLDLNFDPILNQTSPKLPLSRSSEPRRGNRDGGQRAGRE
eukprot:3242971-Rhodomonas_salina.1